LSEQVGPDQAIRLNLILTSGVGYVTNLHGLESAFGRPLQTFGGGIFFYKSVVEQAAALLEALCQNHPFSDGNKRTAWMCTVTYLHANNVPLRDVDNDEAAEFVERVVTHEYEYFHILLWLIERLDTIRE